MFKFILGLFLLLAGALCALFGSFLMMAEPCVEYIIFIIHAFAVMGASAILIEQSNFEV